MLSWEERHDDAAAHVVPFLERAVGLEGARVLEFGAGAGPISCALAPHVASVLGLDIAAGDVEHGHRLLAERRIENVELRAGDFPSLLEQCTARAGEVDVFLLYAVLEHMTLDERLAVLATAKAVLAPGGAVCIFESPNRLLWWDHHTSQLPFFGMLETPLALAYAGRSARAGFAADLEQAGDGAELALARYGRGVSQHELEVALGPLDGTIVAGGYEPELLPIRHIHREELYLARFGGTLPSPPSPVFSRYWLDLVLRFDAPAPAPLVTPWPFATDQSYAVALTPWETLHFVAAESWLAIPSGSATELLLGVEGAPGAATVRFEAGAAGAPVLELQRSERTHYATVALDGSGGPIRLSATPGTQLSFAGLRGPAPGR